MVRITHKKVSVIMQDDIEVRSYVLTENDLPPSSYRKISDFGEFIPYILAGYEGLQEHKQLNFLNLFVTQKLGMLLNSQTMKITNHIKTLERQNKNAELQEELDKLPRNLRILLQYEQNKTSRIAHLENSLEQNIYNLTKKLDKIANSLEEMKTQLGLNYKPTNNPLLDTQ